MSTVYLITCCVLLGGAFLVLYRALTGPTVFDRILAGTRSLKP